MTLGNVFLYNVLDMNGRKIDVLIITPIIILAIMQCIIAICVFKSCIEQEKHACKAEFLAEKPCAKQTNSVDYVKPLYFMYVEPMLQRNSFINK